jgi:hypothetical protein
MKRFSLVIAMLSMFAAINSVSANEFTSANACQLSSGAATYSWDYLSASVDGTYVICPVTRTYSWINTGRIYVNNNPSGKQTCGYINFISLDGSYAKYTSQKCTTTTGRSTIDFGNNPVDTQSKDGYLTFDITLPSGGQLAGLFTN